MSARQPSINARLRSLAEGLEGIDCDAYQAANRDPCEPIFGLGPSTAPIAFFGRDPGREEVQVGVPFIGAGGRQIRRVLHARRSSLPMRDTAAAVAAGKDYFWANTVPYKPLGNKAWSMAVKRQFQPFVAEVLLTQWQGSEIITLGREAFFWFGIGQPDHIGAALKAHWAEPDRFERCLRIDYQGPASAPGRSLKLHPLPHPSPLNAVWFKRFPALLEARLNALERS